MKINVGILISYDYVYAVTCIRRIYGAADRIVLALDEHLHTWNGGTFEIAPAFFDQIAELDTEHKIEIYRDNFYVPELSTMDNDIRERRMVAKFMGQGREEGWYLQIDADEYFVDFPGFVELLHSIEHRVKGRRIRIWARWITLFKEDDQGFYVITSGERNLVPIAFTQGVRTGDEPNMIDISCEYGVLHQSWARPDSEIAYKLGNWGHNADFDTEGYLQFWRSVNRYNVSYIRDFHPLSSISGAWHRLQFVEGDIESLVETFVGKNDRIATAKISHCSARRALSARAHFLRTMTKIYHNFKKNAKQ